MPVKTPAPGDLEPIERASRDELQALQLQRLQRTLAARLRQRAALPRGLRRARRAPVGLQVARRPGEVPVHDKNDLRDNYPFGMFAVPREQVVRVHASSGTTGKPTVVGYTQGDIDTWADLVARSIRASGGRAGDIVHVAYGYGLFTGGLGAHYGAEKLGCTVIPMSGGQTEKQVQLIEDFRPDIIMVTPSYMQVIVEEMLRQGMDPRALVAQDRHLRRRTLDRGDAPRHRGPRRHRRGRHLRPVGSDGPGRGQRMHRDQGRPGDLGGPFLPRDHRPRDRRGAARRAAKANWSSPR